MYTVPVYHGPKVVGQETIKAKNFMCAHVLGSYVCRTVAQAAVHPSEYDPGRVSFVVFEAAS